MVRYAKSNAVRSERVTLNARAHIFFDFKPWKLHFEGRLVNVSATGALIEAKAPNLSINALLEAEGKCQLQIDLTDLSSDSYFGTARVARLDQLNDTTFVAFEFETPISAQLFSEWQSPAVSAQ